MRRFFKPDGNLRLILVAAAVALISGSTVAVAGSLITSQDIQNGTIKPVDISKKLRKKIYRQSSTLAAAIPGQAGTAGTAGVNGVNGVDGADGSDGADAEFTAGHWGSMDRNTIGSPVAELRAGPYGTFGVTGPLSEPPFGEGSLRLAVNDVSGKVEKAAFGNEVDFFGDKFADISKVGFRVFQTGENCGFSSGVCNQQGNMPNITFEVDPNLATSASNYSSLVFVPTGIPGSGINKWSTYIDATLTAEGLWYFTGGAGTVTNCNESHKCTFSEVKTVLAADDLVDSNPTTLYTVAVGKGRDNAWQGAIDGLRINDTIYDFEPLGVEEIPAS